MVKKKKALAFLTLVIMIINMFSPYTALVVHATTGTLEDDPLVFQNMGVTTKTNGKRILRVQVALSSDEIQSGMDLTFKFDTTKLQPCNKNTGLAVTASQVTMNNLVAAQNDYYMGTIYTKSYTLDSANNIGKINLITVDAGGTDIVGNGYQGPVMGDPNYDTGAAQFPDRGYYPIIDLYFLILDSTITSDSIPSELFSLNPVGASAPTGCRIEYYNADGLPVTKDIANINYGGFAVSDTRTVTGIAIKTNPINTTYEHGDTIDLTGGEITVTYDDGTTEDIDMTDPSVSITTPSDGKAYVSTPTVTISYEGKTATFNTTVTDPVTSLTITSPMAQTEYTHGDNIDFAGLQLLATRASGATETLTQSSTGVTTSENLADVNSATFTQTSAAGVTPVRGTQKITFAYEGKTVDATIVVNDTITGISLVSQPTKTIYKRGESLDLSGAKVEITFGSGATQEINLPDGSITVGTFNNTLTGSKQNLSVVLGTITATDTIDVEVYNYIASVTFTAPLNVNPNYNTELNLAGGKFDLTWQDGTTTSVNLTESSVTVTGYSKTNLEQQTITATYTTKYTLSDGTEIPETITRTFIVEVYNPLTAIVITPPTKTEYNHGESLDLASGTITVTYANGDTLTPAMTMAMITEADGSSVNMSPLASEYTDYELSKTLKIQITEDGVTETVNYPITIKNNVTGISMNNLPTDTNYKIGDAAYKLAGGDITVNRAAGDTQTVALTDPEVTVTPALNTLTTTAGTKTVTVGYEGQTTIFDITVENAVSNIVVTAPTKTIYNHGEALDLSDGTITVNYLDGTSTSVTMTESMITEGGSTVDMSPDAAAFGTATTLNKTLTITYAEGGVT